jgi:hypothetical protein
MRFLKQTFIMAMWLCGCQACTPSTLPAAENLGICILDGYATDAACRPVGGNALACTEDIAKKCGTDTVSVVNTLAAHKKAVLADQTGAL